MARWRKVRNPAKSPLLPDLLDELLTELDTRGIAYGLAGNIFQYDMNTDSLNADERYALNYARPALTKHLQAKKEF